MKVIAVVASKGGVGKSTVSNVIAGLISESNKKAEVWDSDCNQFSSETMSFSDLLSYPVRLVSTIAELDALKKSSKADYVVIDTAPHAHDSKLFIHILNLADTIIGVTKPFPNDVLAFQKIMLPLLENIKKPSFLLVNQKAHIQSSIQKAALDLIDDIKSSMPVLDTALYNRASYAAIGYFEEDEKADKKRIEETQTLKQELIERGVL